MHAVFSIVHVLFKPFKVMLGVTKVGRSTLRSTPTKCGSFHLLTRNLSASDESRSIRTVGTIGQGLMGHGITQIAASSPHISSVVAYDPSGQAALEAGKSRILKSLDKMMQREKITSDDAEGVLGKIVFTDDIAALGNIKGPDIVIEAIIEDLGIKQKLYGELDGICPPTTIFASNTSSLSVESMSTAVSDSRKENFVGLHFFNPVQLMKLVEVIRAPASGDVAVDAVMQFCEDVDRKAVQCKDTPGFVVNRLLVPALVQAMEMLDRGDVLGGVPDIDACMQLGAGHPMGPFHLADYIGLDTTKFILDGWIESYPDNPSFTMPACLVKKVKSGHLGRKSGQGFYHWDGDKRGDPVKG